MSSFLLAAQYPIINFLDSSHLAPLRRQLTINPALHQVQHERAIFTMYRNPAIACDVTDNSISSDWIAAFCDAGHQVIYPTDSDVCLGSVLGCWFEEIGFGGFDYLGRQFLLNRHSDASGCDFVAPNSCEEIF